MGDLDTVVGQFREAVECRDDDFRVELMPAPHEPSSLEEGWQGVYAFRLGTVWVKAGKAGPNSGPRWVHQHYTPGNASSTLSMSRIKYAHAEFDEPRLPQDLKVRLRAVHPDHFSEWLRRNTDRCEIKIRAEPRKQALDNME